MTYAQLSASPASGIAIRGRLAPVFDEARALVRLAVPIMFIALVNMGMSVTDTVMVAASFGPATLAAVAVGSDLYSILFYLGAGTIAGIAPFYAAAVAADDPARCARLERVGRRIILLLTAVLVPVVWTAPDWLVRLGLEQDLLEVGRGYTRTMALTLVPMLGVVLYRTILTAAERPRVFLKITAAMLPLNAALNLILMNGLGPIPSLGPTGAGLATLIVSLASLVTLNLIATRHMLDVETTRDRIGWREVTSVLRVGIPIGIATVAELGIFLGATIYAATLGAADVAAHTLTLRVAGVAYAVPAALLQAALVRMARAQAQADPAVRRRVIHSTLLLTLGAGTVLLMGLATAAKPLSHAFFDESPAGMAAASLTVGLLLLLGAMEFVANPGSGAAGLLRGQKDVRVPMLFTLAGYWLVGAPLGLWLCHAEGLGISGIWIGLAAGTAVTSGLMLARLARTARAVSARSTDEQGGMPDRSQDG